MAWQADRNGICNMCSVYADICGKPLRFGVALIYISKQTDASTDACNDVFISYKIQQWYKY